MLIKVVDDQIRTRVLDQTPLSTVAQPLPC